VGSVSRSIRSIRRGMATSHGPGVEVQQIYLDIHFGHVSGKVPKQKGVAKVHAKGLKPWRGESAEGHPFAF